MNVLSATRCSDVPKSPIEKWMTVGRGVTTPEWETMNWGGMDAINGEEEALERVGKLIGTK